MTSVNFAIQQCLLDALLTSHLFWSKPDHIKAGQSPLAIFGTATCAPFFTLPSTHDCEISHVNVHIIATFRSHLRHLGRSLYPEHPGESMKVFIPLSDEQLEQLDSHEPIVPYQAGVSLLSQCRRDEKEARLNRDEAPECPRAPGPILQPCPN